jgi:hypothetical protein
MRVMRAAAAGLLTLLMIAPSALGQWQDPKDDHEVGYTVANQADESTYVWTKGDQTGWYPLTDFLEAKVSEETDDTIRFGVKVASLKTAGNEPHDVDIVRYTFAFTLHGESRAVQIAWYPKLDRGTGFLGTYDKGRFRFDEQGEFQKAADGFQVEFAKERFRDAKQVPVRTGDVLEKITVKSQTYLFSTYNPCSARSPPVQCWKGRDQVGTGTLGDYVVSRSAPGVGHVALTSMSPFRSSNGLATTYIFELDLHNLADASDAAFVKLDQIPADWKMSWPGFVEVPAKSSVKFPIAATVPFSHLHGKETYVNVTATSQRDPSVSSRFTIGVVWTKIPQPAGHHAELYVHVDDAGDSWVNTLAEDPDAKADAKGDPCCFSYSGTRKSYRWDVPLNPPLQSGLDFDLGRTLHAELHTLFREAARPNATLRVYVEREDRSSVTIAQGSLPAAEVKANDIRAWVFDLPILPQADRIPFVEESNLFMEVEVAYDRESSPLGAVTTSRQQDPYPLLVQEHARLDLPLVEYVDQVDEGLLSSLTRYTLAPKTANFKEVNPDRVAVFAVDVTNTGGRDDDISWRLIGSNTEWAEVYPERMSLPAGDNATIVVTVRPPEAAVEGEHAEMLLLGQSSRDPNAQVFVRLVAQVVTSKDVPSEDALANEFRGIAAQNAESSAPALAAVLLTLIGAVLTRRRR